MNGIPQLHWVEIIWLLHNLVEASFDLFRDLLLVDQLEPWKLHPLVSLLVMDASMGTCYPLPDILHRACMHFRSFSYIHWLSGSLTALYPPSTIPSQRDTLLALNPPSTS